MNARYNCVKQDLDTKATDHDAIHLLQSNWSRLGNFVLNECEAFVLFQHRVVRQTDGFYGTERQKRFFDGVFLDGKVYRSNVYSVEKWTDKTI